MNSYIYFVRIDEEISCFYSKNSSICYKNYENSAWGDENILLNKVNPNFTMQIATDNKTLNLYYQNTKGEVFLGSRNKESSEELKQKHKFEWKWEYKCILNDIFGEVNFSGINKDNQLCLIYNTNPTNSTNVTNGINNLIHQTLNLSNSFSSSQIIDTLYKNFIVQYINQEHLLIFYAKKQNDFVVGYREMTTSRISGFYPFYKGAFPLVDFSVLTTNSEIHVVYISKNMFSCQLCYRKKNENLFSTAILLKELRSMDTCFLYILNNILYVNYSQNGDIFEIMSNDNGLSFSSQRKIGNISHITKANYISNIAQNNMEFFIRNILVDANDPTTIISANDLSSFYPKKLYKVDNIFQDETVKEVIKENSPVIVNQNNSDKDLDKEKNLEKFKKLIGNYEYQIHIKNKEVLKLKETIDDKDYEISQLKKELEKNKLTLSYYENEN